MAWSAETSEGFLLAATVAGDRLAEQGARGVTGPAQVAVQSLVKRLSALPKAERRRQIEAISQRMTAPLGAVRAKLPPRALSLLSPIAERDLADTWLQQAPPPRLGYRAEPGLRQILSMIAERGSWHA